MHTGVQQMQLDSCDNHVIVILCSVIYIFGISMGAIIPWMDEIRYLGVFIVRSRLFKCLLHHAKKSFYAVATFTPSRKNS